MRDIGVLVVDDESEILVLIERMFAYFKIKIDCARNATEALNRLKTKDYRTMITDLEMTDMDGLELSRKAHEMNPTLNIVLFTGDTTSQILNLVLDPKISDISEVYLKPSGLNDMLMGIITRETGRIFLME